MLVNKKSKNTPKLSTDMTNCRHVPSTRGTYSTGVDTSRMFSTYLISVLLKYSFSQLLFTQDLIPSKFWVIVVGVIGS